MSIVTAFKRVLRRTFGARPGNAAEQVTRAYEIVLGRTPDDEGLRAYTDNVVSRRQTVLDVVQELLRSPEAEASGRSGWRPSLASAVSPERNDAAVATKAVSSLYQSILCRNGDEAGVAAHTARILHGEIDLPGLAQEFLASDEFALRFSRHLNVARQIVEILIVGLTGRHPGQAGIESYANAMVHGYPLREFLDELKRSPEFGSSSPNVGAVNANPHVVMDIGNMVQDYIVALTAREGGVTSLPPIASAGPAAITMRQMAAMIRTLAMFGASAPIASSPVKR